MIFPMMQTSVTPSRKQVIEFKGYDTQNVIDPGSMRRMKNLSSDEFPPIYQRKQRGTYSDVNVNPSTILTRNEKLAVCDSTSFWYDGQRIFDFTMQYEGLRQMQAINTRIVIWPDKLYYDTETGEYGDLGNEIHATSVHFHKDSVTKETCCTITLPTGVTLNGFSKGDAISFSGLSELIKGYYNGQTNNIENAIIERIEYDDNEIYFADGVISYPSMNEQDFDDTGEDGAGFDIFRKIPDLDYILEYGNRLYGCKGNTIYASKLGDPTNFFYYSTGTADSSYTVDVGTDGDFTGIAPYPTHIIFFKENYMHKLYGYKPANYQLITTQCLGLEKGSHKSVQLINNTVFYKSREGIMTYSGDIPHLISQNFGKTRYDSAVSGTDGMKYYVSMRNKEDDAWYMFVFDIDKGLWHLEDNTHALDFAYIKDQLVYSDYDKNKIITTVGDETNKDKEPIEWYARFGDYDEYDENKKVYSRIDMRLKMEEDSEINVWISVDEGAWESVYRLSTHFKRTVEMPIIPRRCDKFAILITGTGYVKIESMVRCVREGTMR